MNTSEQMESINRETTALTQTTRWKRRELKGASATTDSSPRLGSVCQQYTHHPGSGVGIDTVEQGVRENEDQSKDNHSN